MTQLDLEALETAHERRVHAFCKTWEQRDVSLLLPFLSETVHYTMWDSQDAIEVHGKAQFEETVGPFLESTQKVEFEILRSSAMGKIVTNERHDRFVFEGDMEWFFPVVGVFVIEDDKIQYWKDFVTPGKPIKM